MPLDVASVRSQFPALRAGAAHFDGPGGSQTPEVVADAVRATLVSAIANRGSVTPAERAADETVEQARAAMGDLLAAPSRGIVFGRSMTQLTFDVARAMAKTWRPGDEIVVSRLDHDANVRPWVITAERAGATVRWTDFDPATAELTPAHVAAELSPRTRLVALTGASNLLGTRPDLATISDIVHDAGAVLFVDGVHLTAHAAIDVRALGADLFVCSPYKFFGPHCGVLAAEPALLEQLHPDKLLPSSDDIPERFELGTLPYELMAGTSAAVEFIAALSDASGTRRERIVASMRTVEEHEDGLRERIEKGLSQLPDVTVHSRAASRTPTLLLTFAGRDPAQAYRFLADRGVNAPAGTFYAYEPAQRIGIWPVGGLRVGLAPYTDDSDIERLLDGFGAFTS
ncbi:MAG TPA: cysteine desulfurase-like protein [Jatrophihabitans sp.]|jgi:cysteine desulfurase family protein (TIGR01976 family)